MGEPAKAPPDVQSLTDKGVLMNGQNRITTCRTFPSACV